MISLITVAAVLISWDILLRAWSRVNFKGSAEWVMGVIVRKMMRVRSEGRPWHDLPKLGLLSKGKGPQWIELEPVKPRRSYDSKLALVLSIFGFLFFPLSIISLRLSRYALKKEGRNLYNRTAAVISWIGIFFFISWALVFSQIRGIVIM